MGLYINWICPKDLPDILDIECHYEDFWTEQDIRVRLKSRTIVGQVCTNANAETVGYMIYELFKNSLSIQRFIVRPDYLRRRVGSRMMDYLKNRMQQSNRKKLTFTVSDAYLDLHLFLKYHGFFCKSVIDGENYHFVYKSTSDVLCVGK